jgi:serine/threonine protein kinase
MARPNFVLLGPRFRFTSTGTRLTAEQKDSTEFSMTEEMNKRIGDYQVLNELGSGGMGRVYKVRNVISDRIEAMKILLPDLAGRQELAARFLREIKLMASLNHPNIAALRTAFTFENQLIMVMEYVEGTTVAALLEKGALPPTDAVNYIDQVLAALSYAHQQHIIHRDIKPANMMLTPQGVIKLMDFGIARAGDEHTLTMTGTTLGSLGYMSPEQVKGEATDARSDLYSVGVSLYEMVTGQRPFRAESDYSVMTAHVKEMPKPPVELQPSLPAVMNDLIFVAIAKDPAKRFQSADAFRNALNSVRAALPAPSAAVPKPSSGFTTVDSVPATVSRIAVPAPAAPVAAPVITPQPSPVAVPSVMSMSPPPTPGHRGLYMTLGALVVLAVLAAAGIYMPRHSKTAANSAAPAAAPSEMAAASTPQAPATPQPATLPGSSQQLAAAAPAEGSMQAPPAAAPAAPSAPAAAPAEQSSPAAVPASDKASLPVENSTMMKSAMPAHAHHATKAAAAAQPEAAPPPEASANPQPAGNNAADLDVLEREVDQLSNRAAAVNSSLDRLQQQQASSGYGLRGDMAARQASMKNNLLKAQDAAERGDVARAKRYMDQAQSDVEALEHFLGH